MHKSRNFWTDGPGYGRVVRGALSYHGAHFLFSPRYDGWVRCFETSDPGGLQEGGVGVLVSSEVREGSSEAEAGFLGPPPSQAAGRQPAQFLA